VASTLMLNSRLSSFCFSLFFWNTPALRTPLLPSASGQGDMTH
jgi:hypothetical protein